MTKVKELRVYFHVRKSHFNKLNVEELKNVVRNVFGVKTRMKKQEMIDFLTNEYGVDEITISGKDLTLERMYQLKEMSGWLKDYGKDDGFGHITLHHYIEDFNEVFPFTCFIPGGMTHKQFEIYNEMGMRGEIDESVEDDKFDRVDKEFQKYNLYYDFLPEPYYDIDNWNDLMIPTKTCNYQIGYLKERQLMGMVM